MNPSLKLSAASGIALNSIIDSFAPTSIVPVFFQGISTGMEFLTYSANKLYFALECEAVYSSAQAVANYSLITFYNETNAASFYWEGLNAVYDGAGVKYSNTPAHVQNVYFSRVVLGIYFNFKFIGYKLTK